MATDTPAALASRATPPESVAALLEAFGATCGSLAVAVSKQDSQAIQYYKDKRRAARARLDASLAGLAEDGERLRNCPACGFWRQRDAAE